MGNPTSGKRAILSALGNVWVWSAEHLEKEYYKQQGEQGGLAWRCGHACAGCRFFQAAREIGGTDFGRFWAVYTVGTKHVFWAAQEIKIVAKTQQWGRYEKLEERRPK